MCHVQDVIEKSIHFTGFYFGFEQHSNGLETDLAHINSEELLVSYNYLEMTENLVITVHEVPTERLYWMS